jgi:hypothetical protein
VLSENYKHTLPLINFKIEKTHWLLAKILTCEPYKFTHAPPLYVFFHFDTFLLISREYGGAPIFLHKIWIKINFTILCFILFYPIYFIFLNNIGFQSFSFKGNKRWVSCKVSTMMKRA